MAAETFIVKVLRAEVTRVVKRLTLQIDAELKKAPSEGGTPVDTGHARANWVPSIGEPFSGIAGSREAVSTAEAMVGAAEVAATYKTGPTFITNNVPYIQKLNFGSSQQAPAGFVQDAIRRAIKVVQ